MKFSVFTLGMPEYNLEQTVAKLHEYGYNGVEWRVQNLPKDIDLQNPPAPSYWGYNKSTVAVDNVLEKAEEIKNLCDQYGLEIAALATYLQCGEVGKIDQVLQAASVMACPRIRVNVPVYDGSENYNDVFAKTVSEIRVLEKLAKKYNVKINFEIHHKRIIPSVSAAYRLVSDFDSRYIGVIHDAGNMVHEGYEQYKMGLEILGTYLDHVHIKNARWINEDMPAESDYRWKAEWCPLKKGQVNFKVLLDALKAVGYDGYLSFEDFSNEVSTDEKLEGNIAFIKSIL